MYKAKNGGRTPDLRLRESVTRKKLGSSWSGRPALDLHFRRQGKPLFVRSLMRIRLFVPAAMLLLAAGTAGAQIPSITLFGGAVMPTGDAGDGLNAGFTAGAALDMHLPATPFGVRAEGSYSRFGVQGLAGSGFDAHTSDLGFNLNGVMTILPLPLIKPYITAGPSYSNLKVSASDGTNSGSQSEGHWGLQRRRWHRLRPWPDRDAPRCALQAHQRGRRQLDQRSADGRLPVLTTEGRKVRRSGGREVGRSGRADLPTFSR